ncbi:MAG: nitroreductase family protein [Candidatus Dadabacteria bacterium]|nr:nitroreductase family protein [Candidatus Dadabacteria bacterium]
MINEINIREYRKPEYEVDEIFLKRWSPRAMSGEDISHDELMSLFEAAKWAPSSFNNQPWRFLYARRDTDDWELFFNLLVEGNKIWAKNASALIVIISKKTFDQSGNPSRTHSFDAGASWQNLALQGSLKGLVVHGMQGFDYDKARELLNIPEEYEVEAMVAVGKPGKKEELPERLQQREIPSGRKKISEIVLEGRFKE